MQFTCFWCLTSLGESSVEACADFLVGWAVVCLLVHGAGSWPPVGRSKSRVGLEAAMGSGSIYADCLLVGGVCHCLLCYLA